MITGLGGAAQTPGFVVLRGLGPGTHSEMHGRNADPARHMVGLTTNDITGDSGNVSIATRKDPEGNLVQLLQLPGARG